jgi:hypothetical protein
MVDQFQLRPHDVCIRVGAYDTDHALESLSIAGEKLVDRCVVHHATDRSYNPDIIACLDVVVREFDSSLVGVRYSCISSEFCANSLEREQ